MSEGFASALLAWYDRAGRHDLPWQTERTPYRVWVAEIMLQQTQVATVIPYFLRFTARFPDLATLATASLDEVLHLWSGLGYYARARHLHQAARLVMTEHGGELPMAHAALQSLPGIGRSTAGAVLAQAHGQRHPILDGNAKRVLARWHAVAGWPGEARVARRLWELAERHTPELRIADYTQAIMDLGATVCRQSHPDCDGCPVAAGCEARRCGQQARFPGRRSRLPRPQRSTRMLLLQDADGAVLLQKRPPQGIWGGLWCPPELGAESAAAWAGRMLGAEVELTPPLAPVRHGFTHFELDIEPVPARLAASPRCLMEAGQWVWYNARSPARLGLAAVVSKLIGALEPVAEAVKDA